MNTSLDPDRVDAVCDAFERAWRAGPSPPEIGAFLNGVPPEHRAALLVELACVDLEYRWRADSGVSAADRRLAEDYLRDIPDAPVPEPLLLRLLAVEIRVRSHAGEPPDATGYQERFSALPSQLEPLLAAGAQDAVDGAKPAQGADAPQDVDARFGSTEIRSLLSTGDLGHPLPSAPPLAPPPTPAPTPIDDADDPPPERIGRYRVVGPLGDGAFGRVWLAHDEILDCPVAIKVPKRERISRPEDVDRYLAEARTLRALDGHPHIVPVHDADRTPDGLCYVVSKYIEGSDLERRVRQSRPGFRDAADMIALLAGALHHAHTRGIIHRDLKPANILIDTADTPYLADFGLALRDEDYGRGGPQLAGTPAYMSPEQARCEGHRVDGRSDLFSLGVVFYELLTGKRPFRGDSTNEVLDQIRKVDVRPPRQLDDTIPRELERICLKLLTKRAADRYATARDLVDDLRHWLKVWHDAPYRESAVADAASVVTMGHRSAIVSDAARIGPTRAGSADAGSVKHEGRGSDGHGTDVASDSRPLRIVPKGLRSFDAHDADFFLDLLPGPRDRDGLPDSIRFWKTRLEQTDPDNTFTVGLIYGPSGCGKSSLMKAGLLPRLSPNVISVYVEATADETETRLLNGLRKRCPGLNPTLNLTEALATLRRGQGLPHGKKVVLVLDQFEQWLHAKKDDENTELVQALRQCDGGRVQAVVMVRDDFWLAVSRFLRELEVRLLEGHNSALADLFDLDHARKVLSAFGRAFGKLPDGAADLSSDARQFIEQSVAGLSQEGKVICVRLALFADIMKGKPWTAESLKVVGGTEGVGVTFLEETFSASTAPPEHRYHQKAARAVLKSLLPESGTDIKGHMRSRDELLVASGYAQRPRDFDDLLHLLDAEIRLITPTDPEGQERDDAPSLVGRVSDPSVQASSDSGATRSPSVSSPSSPSSESHPQRPDGSETRPTGRAATRYYQLTHDYLVPSLRDWLTRKQRETRRGRAELLLAERAAAWNARPLNRNLPAWHEDLRIRLLTNRATRTEPQRRIMKASGLYHATRWGLALVVLCVLGLGGQRYESNRRAEIARQTRENNEKRAESLADAVFTAHPQVVPITIENLKPLRELALPVLQERYADESKPQDQRLHAALALAAFGQVETKFLVESIATASDGECRNLVTALSSSAARDAALPLLQERFAAADATKDATTRARLAIVALHLGDARAAIDLCRIAEDPTPRRIFEETLATWNGGLNELAEQVQQANDGPLRAAVCLGLGRMKPDSVPDAERQAGTQFLLASYQQAPDTGTHGAADWALRQWNVELPALADATQPSDKRHWYVNSAGQTMLKLPAGKFRMGSEKDTNAKPVDVTLTRPFYLANREVSVGQFQQFIDDPNTPAAEKPKDWIRSYPQSSPTDAHLATEVNWYDAVLYCNWLSRREGRTPAYERTGEKEKNGAKEYDAWRRLPNADGYRLPTEAEWEYACRAGTTTDFSCGDDEDVLRRYAVFAASSTAPCGNRLPNGWGLFDLHGNLWEWCGDWDDRTLPGGTDPEVSKRASHRVLRGGSWNDDKRFCRSAYRHGGDPGGRINCLGVRVAAVREQQ